MSDLHRQSRIYKPFYRNGPSHRDGADVSFGDIVKIFGFKTATVGAWVTSAEQQIAANLFFDALCDLMTILEVPEQVISLNGTLSIAFGSGGQKHASAHYNASTRTLALAKNAGAGALSHEWFHSFDHFITTKFIQSAKPNEFASASWLEHKDIFQHPLNSRLDDCFQYVFLDINNKEQLSTLFKSSVSADKALDTYYYSMPQEICARAFESFIQDHAIKNAFLVQGTKQSEEAKLGIYPQAEQRKLINDSFLRYFKLLGQALSHKRETK